MIHFKSLNNTQGFTFIEVALALLVLGIMLSAALGLQQSSFASILKYSERLQHIFLLKNVLFDAAFARSQNQGYDQAEKKADEDATTSLRSFTKKVSEGSVLHVFQNIVIETAQATWSGALRTTSETLIRCIYKPEKNEKEKP